MEKSAGIAVIYDNKILMSHATRAKWFGSWMPPKGGIEKGEDEKDAACREMKEECGISISKDKLGKRHLIRYTKGAKVYKEVYIYEVHTDNLSELGIPKLIRLTLPDHMLQLDEIDAAVFMDYDECMKRILPRYADMVENILGNK